MKKENVKVLVVKGYIYQTLKSMVPSQFEDTVHHEKLW